MSNVTITPAAGAVTVAGAAPGNWPSSAFLFVTEFGSALANMASGMQDVPRCPSLVDQLIPFGGISVASAPFGSQTRVVRVHSTANCSLRVGGVQPVAGGCMRLAAGVSELYAVVPGDSLAVVTTA